jgi:hypothetical protein
MAHTPPRNADEVKLSELQEERTRLQGKTKKGQCLEEFASMADQVQRLREVQREYTRLYIKTRGL